MRWLLRLLKVVAVILLVLGLAAFGFLYWASRGYDPDEPAAAPRVDEALLASQSVPAAPASLRVLSYNVAYGRGPVDDIGDRRAAGEIRGFLSALAAFLRAENADVVALQEVDVDSARTHHLDQLSYLASESGYPYSAFVTTWRANYVPHPLWPPSQHIGGIHSGQAVLSRYPITSNERVVLPQPEGNPFWYNLFYLHRAIQVVDVEVGERTVRIYNCHLEAFDQPNRERHAERVVERVRADARERWMVLGDMNAPPPEAARRGNFDDAPGWDATTDRTIETLRSGLGALEVPGLEAYETVPADTFTFPAEAPTRRLDYIFASTSLPAEQAGVAHQAGPISDHLPVRAQVRMAPPDLPNRRAVPAGLPPSESSR